MKLITWNVNGIRAVLRKGELQNLLDKENPDILMLQEIKANEDQIDEKFDGYHASYNSAKKAGYSGTAILTKVKPISVRRDIPAEIAGEYPLNDKYGDTNSEGRVSVVELEDMFVCSVYTPNSKADLTRLPMREKAWDPAFLEYMSELNRVKPVVFAGDLNVAHTEIDLAKPKENRKSHGFTDEERAGVDEIIAAGFVDSFRYLNPDKLEAYTWWSNFGGARARNVGWRIDYFFVAESIKDRIKSVRIMPEQMGSDHCPVVLELEG